MTWVKVQRAFIIRFSEIRNEGQIAATLQYVKQKKYESVEDYYDEFHVPIWNLFSCFPSKEKWNFMFHK